jgi:deoxycytidine triphosphate deaminase
MTLLAGVKLDKNRFFQSGNPVQHGSSFDLTIGRIYDENGNRVEGQYVLRPNEMIQVSSDEVFGLPNDVTAHVTYKTALTSNGIWALTVGIVDPGWNCPISTTLFNFSKVDFAVQEGAAFLRVSFFEHEAVADAQKRVGRTAPEYLRSVQGKAATHFPKKFLDVDRVSEKAGSVAVRLMQDKALTWIAMTAGLFALIQLVMSWGPPTVDWYFDRPEPTKELARKFQDLEGQVRELRGLLENSQLPTTGVGAPPDAEQPPIQPD